MNDGSEKVGESPIVGETSRGAKETGVLVGRIQSPTIGLSVSRSVAVVTGGSSASFGSRAPRRSSGFLARTSVSEIDRSAVLEPCVFAAVQSSQPHSRARARV